MNAIGPKVSILIPAYNASSFIEETIQSAVRQSWENKEIIIVDDGSTDDTFERARKYEPAVKVFRQQNKGASAARNRCLHESTGSYIQYLDADDTLARDKIGHQMKMVKEFGDTCIYSGSWALFYNAEARAEFHPTELWKNYSDPIEWLVTAWTKQKWMHPTSWLTPRGLIEKVGLWDESLSLHDDGEFFCRVLLRSTAVHFCADAKSYYRKGIDTSLSSIFSEKAIQSHFKICNLYESHLLSVENSPRTRRGCASNYLAFHYEHFPKYTNLRKMAIASAQRLGGADNVAGGTTLFHSVKAILGWKCARRIERFYYGYGLNRSVLKKFFRKKAY